MTPDSEELQPALSKAAEAVVSSSRPAARRVCRCPSVLCTAVTMGSPPGAEVSPGATHALTWVTRKTLTLSQRGTCRDSTHTAGMFSSGVQGSFLLVLTQRGREEWPVVAQRASMLSVHNSGTGVRAGPSPLSQT